MSLDIIIPPEVLNDDFSAILSEIAGRKEIKTILEIGSSSGSGSTQALVNGILKKDFQNTKLFCMELSRARFLNLVNTYKDKDFIKPYNLSSITISEFPSEGEVAHFYNTVKTNLNLYSLETVLSWLKSDVEYINHNCLDFCGIEFIKSCNQIKKFDFVLIDGSEFTGEAELQHVWGAKIIALDDVNTFKCFAPFKRLIDHYSYKLIKKDLSLRNGYALFERNF